jgi:sigma-E factor negative regulatory protein RseC
MPEGECMFGKGVHGEVGEVTDVYGNRATVKIGTSKGCERCGLCTPISDTEMAVQAYTRGPVQIGDQVVLGFRPGVIVQSAFILYLIPLIALVVGYYVGKLLFPGGWLPGREELLPALTSLVFLFVSFVPIRYYDKRKEEDKRFRVYIKELA